MEIINDKNIISIKDIIIDIEKYNQIIDLYSNFGILDKNIITKEKLNDIKNIIKNNIFHNIFFYCDNSKNIIGAITLILEQKIIHNGGNTLHIEDFVIKKDYRKKNIGNIMINFAIEYAKTNNCYKVILDCNEKLSKHYIKYNFINKGIYMGLYF